MAVFICYGMKGKDKDKQKMAIKPLELGKNEATSRLQVGVQDSICTVAPQQVESQTMPEGECQGEVRRPNASLEPVISVESDKPLFGTQLGVGAKLKVRKTKLVSSDVEIIDSGGKMAS